MKDWFGDYWNSVREYARDYVLENTSLKVLALLITAVLWLSVASRPVGRIALSGVPIVLPNVPETLIVSKFPLLLARVYLEGPRDVVESLRGGQIEATADMTGVEPGVRVIPLKIDPASLPANIKVKDIEPPSITVTVERVIEKEVPITPRFEGQPAPGFEVIDWQIDPPLIRISGAESQVRDINEVSTETVRLSDRTAPFDDPVAVDIGSPVLEISGDSGRKVTLSVNIGEARTQVVIGNVAVVLLGGPSRAPTFPRSVSVTLYGPRSAVEAIRASDVTAAVEYQPGSRVLVPKIKLSPDFADQVVVRSVEPQTVRVR